MAGFKFKLEAVLRHRRNIEHQRQRDVALIQQQIQQLERELTQLDHGVRDAVQELRNGGLIGRIDLNYLAAHRRYVASAERKAMTLAQKIALVNRELDAKRKSLAEAAVQRKVMEKLRERLQQRWQADVDRRQTDAMDEIGMQIGCRRILESAIGEGGDAA